MRRRGVTATWRAKGSGREQRGGPGQCPGWHCQGHLYLQVGVPALFITKVTLIGKERK